MMILQKKPQQHLQEFSQICETILGIDAKSIVDNAKQLTKYYKGTGDEREKSRELQFLENRWYDGLKKGFADYGIYSEKVYLSDMWACWSIYSRKYLMNIQKLTSTTQLLNGVTKIVDMGCGAGLTTAAFKQIFPNANVIGVNIEDTAQIKLCRHFANIYGFNISTDINEIGSDVDVVFASEYFEHIKEPITHLEDIIRIMNPKMMIIANAFGTISVGHFNEYTINGSEIHGKKSNRIFSAAMRKAGYTMIKCGWWNNKPNVWVRHLDKSLEIV